MPEPGNWCPSLTISSSAEPNAQPCLALTFFHNRYGIDFNDPRDLSLVTSLSTSSFRMLFGAALKADGWRALLQRSDFRDRLRTVDVLVASRCGGHSGYCAELFEVCEPRVIIVPDAASETPTDAERYAPHASGLCFSDGTRRCVLFTRADGTITINEGDAGKTTITTAASQVFAILGDQENHPDMVRIPRDTAAMRRIWTRLPSALRRRLTLCFPRFLAGGSEKYCPRGLSM